VSRRSFKTVNLPRELAEWIDAILIPGRTDPARRPLGIHSRDEFVRIAVALLGAALQNPATGQIPLASIEKLIHEIEAARGKEEYGKYPKKSKPSGDDVGAIH
jgi:hypothetical protein